MCNVDMASVMVLTFISTRCHRGIVAMQMISPMIRHMAVLVLRVGLVVLEAGELIMTILWQPIIGGRVCIWVRHPRERRLRLQRRHNLRVATMSKVVDVSVTAIGKSR